MVLWPRWQDKVHEMGDGRLALTVPRRLHDGLLASAVSEGQNSLLDGIGLRTQQQHPHPQVEAFSGPCAAFVAVDYSGRRAMLEWWIQHRNSQNLHFSFANDSQHRLTKVLALGMEKEPESEHSRSSRWQGEEMNWTKT